MELDMRVMDQFVNEEGSEQERKCWRKIKSAMCEANLADVRAVSHDEICKLVLENLAKAEMEMRNKNYMSAGTQCKIAMGLLYDYAKLSEHFS